MIEVLGSFDLTLFSLSVSVSVRYDDRLPQVPCVAACSESMGLKISGKVRLGAAHLASCPSGTRIPYRYTVSRKREYTPHISAMSSTYLEDDSHATNLRQCAARGLSTHTLTFHPFKICINACCTHTSIFESRCLNVTLGTCTQRLWRGLLQGETLSCWIAECSWPLCAVQLSFRALALFL